MQITKDTLPQWKCYLQFHDSFHFTLLALPLLILLEPPSIHHLGIASEGSQSFNGCCSQNELVVECCNCRPNERSDPEDPLKI